MSSFAAAKAFAKETWNQQFFQDLERAHQTHYEQMGTINGDLIFCPNQTVVNQNQTPKEEEIINIRMNSFRDHSFGTSKFYIESFLFVEFTLLFFSVGSNFITKYTIQFFYCYPILLINFIQYEHQQM